MKHMQHFVLVFAQSQRLTSIKQSADYTALYTLTLVCTVSLLLSHTGFVSLECCGSFSNLLIELTDEGEVVCDGRPQVSKLMNNLSFQSRMKSDGVSLTSCPMTCNFVRLMVS